MSSSIGMIRNPIYGEIKNVPNLQLVLYFDMFHWSCFTLMTWYRTLRNMSKAGGKQPLLLDRTECHVVIYVKRILTTFFSTTSTTNFASHDRHQSASKHQSFSTPSAVQNFQVSVNSKPNFNPNIPSGASQKAMEGYTPRVGQFFSWKSGLKRWIWFGVYPHFFGKP